MSFLWWPPRYWFAVAIALLALLPPRSWRLGLAAAAVAVVVLVSLTLGFETYWSPYQKLEVTPLEDHQYAISVNNTGYMSITNMTPAYLASHPRLAALRMQSSYDAPFLFKPTAGRVLVVGAGAGNDVAGALRNGAEHVDAVEIDPVILSLGERLHPDRPYSSPKVTRVLNDARAFMRQTRERYDVVMFGLLDSHTQFSDFSNMRVDNYVYTDEAFRQALGLLKPDGILVLKFEVRSPWTWMGERFFHMLGNIFGRPPVVFYARSLGHMARATVFIASRDSGLWERAARPDLAAIIQQNPPPFSLQTADPPPATTDDWPYVYHRRHSIPRAYLTVSTVLLAIAFFCVRGVLEPRRASTWQFFFLGAGFLLMETQLISRLALYFGTTWIVNCVAISAILLVLVLANAFVARFAPSRLQPYYALLILFLLANYFFPWQALPYPARIVGVLLSLAYAVPVFFAGIIFAETFRRQAQRSSAFGANIVGAVAGGLAQNLSFVFGMKALLLFGVLFYVAAAIFGARGRGSLITSGRAAPQPA